MLFYAYVLAVPHIGLFSIPPLVVVIRSRGTQQINYIVEVAVTKYAATREPPSENRQPPALFAASAL